MDLQRKGSEVIYTKMVVFIALFFAMTYQIAYGKDTLSPVAVIHQFYEDVSHNRWDEAPYWWIEQQRVELKGFFENENNIREKKGLYNLKEAKLVMWKELPYEYGLSYVPSEYMDFFTKDKKIYYVGVNYTVHKQTQSFIDGTNYFLIAMVRENGDWKIALTTHVTVSSIIEDGHGFGTEDECTYDKRRLKDVD
ncbi:hypothetical protein ACFSCX_15195 [Bacillus salitolerans]|uniref:DUF4829 domain-containing protein n=1 Tax=Bacillus salitolerans TaxID=1437434 RepID=A0ABW4LS40_9BACI